MVKKRSRFVLITILAGILLFSWQSFAAEKQKLRILFTDTYAPIAQRMEALIEEYEKANPNVDIILDVLSWGESLRKVTAMKAAGGAPDLLLFIPAQIWTLQQKGWLQPVDDVIEKLGGDDFFLPRPAYMKLDGHYWCVPKGSSPLHVEYRKDLFEKKGLKAPSTWDDMLAAAKALTEDTDGDGKIDRYGIALPLKREYSVGVFFLSFLWGNGGHVLDKQGKVIFNSPETIQTLEFFKKLYKYAPPGVTDYSWLQLVETYAKDKVAMTIYSGMAPFAKAAKVDQKIANGTAIGSIPTRLPTQTPRARWVTTAWAIMKDTKNPVRQ